MGPEYIGKIHPNCDYFHGQIPYARGVHLYQVSRARHAADGSGSAGSAESPARATGQEAGESRGGELLTGVTGQKADEGRMEEFPADRTGQKSGADQTGPPADDGTGYTYKHAPDLCWYAGKYYIQYLTNPKDEHGGAGVSVLTSSTDGREWGDYRISFPEYWIPPCEVTDYKGLHHVFDGTKPAFMHQRMAFYQAKNGVMLVLGFYGWSPEMWMTNWDNYGIGRVVRRLYPDGSLGAIYFIRVNWQGGWKKEQLLYPLYEESSDAEFLAACRELLASPLVIQQWAEENGDRDPMIRVKHPENGTYQAFCWYHRTEREVVGLWKHSYVSESHDGGESWEQLVRSPSLVMSGQKIWGCRTSDGRYALIYDPTLETQHRFPMCIVTSDDGLHFDRMLLVHGEVPPIRYEGFCKDLGPQYMRGISEGNPRPDGELCVTYSVNKEDIWFARIPVPVCGEEDSAEAEDFRRKENSGHGASGSRTSRICESLFDDTVLRCWNLYQPSWCRIGCTPDGSVLMEDHEPYDYARMVRLFVPVRRLRAFIRLRVLALSGGKSIQIELCSAEHKAAVRIILRPQGRLRHRTVCEMDLGKGRWREGEEIGLEITADCADCSYAAAVRGEASVRVPVTDRNGTAAGFPFMAAVNEIAELSIRTGEPRYLADLEQNPDGLPAEPLGAGPLPEGARVELLGIEITNLTGNSI